MYNRLRWPSEKPTSTKPACVTKANKQVVAMTSGWLSGVPRLWAAVSSKLFDALSWITWLHPRNLLVLYTSALEHIRRLAAVAVRRSGKRRRGARLQELWAWCSERARRSGASVAARWPGPDACDLRVLWRDGALLCALVEALVPGSCPEHPNNNLGVAQAVVARLWGLPPAFTDEELLQVKFSTNFERRLQRYLSAIQLASERRPHSHNARQLSKAIPTQSEIQPASSNCVARGMGLFTATQFHRASFLIYVLDADPSDVFVLIQTHRDFGFARVGQNGCILPSRFSNIPITISTENVNGTRVTFKPQSYGPHELIILRKGVHIPGSPFSIPVDKTSVDESIDKEDVTIPIARKRGRVLMRTVDFVTEKMLLTEDGQLKKIPQSVLEDKEKAPKSKHRRKPEIYIYVSVEGSRMQEVWSPSPSPDPTVSALPYPKHSRVGLTHSNGKYLQRQNNMDGSPSKELAMSKSYNGFDKQSVITPDYQTRCRKTITTCKFVMEKLSERGQGLSLLSAVHKIVDGRPIRVGDGVDVMLEKLAQSIELEPTGAEAAESCSVFHATPESKQVLDSRHECQGLPREELSESDVSGSSLAKQSLEIPGVESSGVENSCVENPVMGSPVVENQIEETPVVETLFVENPCFETPGVDNPVMGNLVMENSAVENLVNETPVMENPVMENQVLENLVEENPAMENPVMENPFMENLVMRNPVVENPAVENSNVKIPVMENPVVESPVVENPVMENSVVANPVLESLVVVNPDVKNPVIENPVEENPVMENPVMENSVAENAVVDSPVLVSPVVEISTVENLIENNPDVENPVEENPVLANPVMENPVMKNSVAENAVVDSLLLVSPVVEISTVENLVEDNPVVKSPVVENRVMENSVVANPVLESPVVVNPVVEISSMENLFEDNPDVESPVMENLSLENPVKENPFVGNLVVENPVMEKPVIENSVVKNLDVENLAVEKPDVECLIMANPIVENRDVAVNSSVASPDVALHTQIKSFEDKLTFCNDYIESVLQENTDSLVCGVDRYPVIEVGSIQQNIDVQMKIDSSCGLSPKAKRVQKPKLEYLCSSSDSESESQFDTRMLQLQSGRDMAGQMTAGNVTCNPDVNVSGSELSELSISSPSRATDLELGVCPAAVFSPCSSLECKNATVAAESQVMLPDVDTYVSGKCAGNMTPETQFHFWPSDIAFGDVQHTISTMEDDETVDFDSVISAPNLEEALIKLEQGLRMKSTPRNNAGVKFLDADPPFVLSEPNKDVDSTIGIPILVVSDIEQVSTCDVEERETEVGKNLDKLSQIEEQIGQKFHPNSTLEDTEHFPNLADDGWQEVAAEEEDDRYEVDSNLSLEADKPWLDCWVSAYLSSTDPMSSPENRLSSNSVLSIASTGDKVPDKEQDSWLEECDIGTTYFTGPAAQDIWSFEQEQENYDNQGAGTQIHSRAVTPLKNAMSLILEEDEYYSESFDGDEQEILDTSCKDIDKTVPDSLRVRMNESSSDESLTEKVGKEEEQDVLSDSWPDYSEDFEKNLLDLDDDVDVSLAFDALVAEHLDVYDPSSVLEVPLTGTVHDSEIFARTAHDYDAVENTDNNVVRHERPSHETLEKNNIEIGHEEKCKNVLRENNVQENINNVGEISVECTADGLTDESTDNKPLAGTIQNFDKSPGNIAPLASPEEGFHPKTYVNFKKDFWDRKLHMLELVSKHAHEQPCAAEHSRELNNKPNTTKLPRYEKPLCTSLKHVTKDVSTSLDTTSRPPRLYRARRVLVKEDADDGLLPDCPNTRHSKAQEGGPQAIKARFEFAKNFFQSLESLERTKRETPRGLSPDACLNYDHDAGWR